MLKASSQHNHPTNAVTATVVQPQTADEQKVTRPHIDARPAPAITKIGAPRAVKEPNMEASIPGVATPNPTKGTISSANHERTRLPDLVPDTKRPRASVPMYPPLLCCFTFTSASPLPHVT
eukprot:GHVR01063886.1.p1 GENE.GHVR01063886.1~~GHVR01063886.1.p1  ORF type:complete len:121 (-),score=0.61 GHVR01063886.1:468-830(-)